jgi:hypothetical protein
MYNIYKILEDGVVIYVGYSRYSCEEFKENMEKYKEYDVRRVDYYKYIMGKGIDKFEYISIGEAETIMEANILKKKYIEEYKPQFNKEHNPNHVGKKKKVDGKGKDAPRYAYFRSGGRLFAVPIAKPNEIPQGTGDKEAKGGANSTTDVLGVQ